MKKPFRVILKVGEQYVIEEERKEKISNSGLTLSKKEKKSRKFLSSRAMVSHLI